jgi:hypothetical protein
MFNTESILIDKRDDFFQSPNVAGDSRFHRGCDSQGLVNPAEVVVHEVNRGVVLVVFQFLAKGVRQTGEPAVAHAELVSTNIFTKNENSKTRPSANRQERVQGVLIGARFKAAEAKRVHEAVKISGQEKSD